MTDFDACATDQAVAERAHAFMPVLSGVLKLECGSHEKVQAGTVYTQHENGGCHRFIQIKGATLRVEGGRLSATATVTDPSGTPLARLPRRRGYSRSLS